MLILFATVAMVHLIALMSPGPDFFFISQTAVSRSRRDAMMGVLGITLGVAVWAAVALLGLHLLLQKMRWLHSLITVGGGVYLCWLGWQLLRAARRPSAPVETPQDVVAHGGRIFFRGLFTNLANPKAVIYFGSVFSLFVGDNITSGVRGGLFILVIGETLLWFSLVALVFALPVMRRGYQRMARWIDGVAGVFFTSFGLGLIISR
ncbi:threonine export protein RhtC [Acerihabitans sp. TG2]|uniref:threonine export protein RhtC n=1 Tax=Acerihabitans sp. TG2 TaxID=3096008 RepID=UPI002B23B1C1|nr:threonine export protein RhtC [Acerihabitans sp. TG2]MEA9390949.1 threonine export protein RhtC [Acerihabitans sp. TG2]